MTSIFNGMAGVINTVLGAPVTYAPPAGDPVSLHSIFRETPIEVATEEGGSVLTSGPSWQVRRDLISGVPAKGAVLTTADGRQWKILNYLISRSVAVDAFYLCELERVE